MALERTQRQYPHPEPSLFNPRLILLFPPFLAGLLAAGLRTAAAAHLIAYWGWPEAIAVAVCLELAEASFLLRWILKRQEMADWLAALGSAVGMAASISLSVLLAFATADRLPWAGEDIGRLTVIVASVGINVVTFLLSRLIAQHVVEHEQAHAAWAQGKLEWLNRWASRLERKQARPAQDTSEVRRKLSKQERHQRILELFTVRSDWSASELQSELDVGRSTVYADLKELAETRSPEGR